MATAATSTYRNAVSGVEVEIPLSFVLEMGAATPLVTSEFIYDYMIDNDLVVSSLEVTKTVGDLAPGDDLPVAELGAILVVTVQKIPFGTLTDAGTVAEDITKTTMANPAAPASTYVKGTKVIAGLGGGTASNFTNGTGSVTLDPVQLVKAVAGTAGQSKQRIRIVLNLTQSVTRATDTGSYSCFIKVGLISCGKSKKFKQGVFFEPQA